MTEIFYNQRKEKERKNKQKYIYMKTNKISKLNKKKIYIYTKIL